MGALAIANDTTKIMTGAISTWGIRSGGGTTPDGVVYFGEMSDAKIEVTSLGRPATRQNEWPHGHRFTATAKVLGTAKAACLAKLNLLNNYVNTHVITLANGQTIGGTNLGTTWKFVCDGGYDADRYLEITADLSFPHSGQAVDFDSIWDPAAQTAATAGDPLYGFAPGASLNAGIYTIGLASAAMTNATLTHFRNTSLVVDPLVVKDSGGRSIQFGCKMIFGFDWMQTGEVGDIDLFNTIIGQNDIDLILTFAADDAIITAPGMGLKYTYNAGGNFDEIAFQRVELSRCYTPAEFVALIS
jgi:hypothetical protein